jgi:hypothetical protein
MRVPRTSIFLAVLPFLLSSSVAQANWRTEVASAFEDDDPYDFNIQIAFLRSLKRGAIKREVGYSGTGPYDINLAKELRFTQITNTLDIRAEAAVFKDLALHFEFPIVISDTRQLDFAQNGGKSCGSPRETDCVTWNNSTLVRDGFLEHSRLSDQTVTIASENEYAKGGGWKLPKRSGLDQFYLGLSWAVLNQVKDSTKPTWVLGFEARISIGTMMEYNPDDPTANTGVSRGYHQLQWFTTVSRRFKYFDPWFNLFYLLPVTRSGSLLDKTTFPLSGQERSGPVQRGGGSAGMEIVVWEQPEKNNKFTIELGAKIEGVFEGRDYSEMWEVFANNPLLKGPCSPLPAGQSIDFTRWDNGTYCTERDQSKKSGDTIPYPGITSIENHAIFSGSFALNFQLTKWFRARAGVAFSHEQQHFITFGDAGKSGNAGYIEQRDETQVNPMYRPYIDATGRRFRVGETTIFDFFLSAMGMF